MGCHHLCYGLQPYEHRAVGQVLSGDAPAAAPAAAAADGDDYWAKFSGGGSKLR